jgi:hypothetical protein
LTHIGNATKNLIITNVGGAMKQQQEYEPGMKFAFLVFGMMAFTLFLFYKFIV